MSEIRICEACGMRFKVTDQELAAIPGLGKHKPVDCPEGLDTLCPSCDPGPDECPSCRVKQDGQRS
jgi:hypothetical protein